MTQSDPHQLEAPAPTPHAPAEAGHVVIYRGGAVVDGTGADVRHGLAVVTDGPAIAAVLPEGELPSSQWPNAETVELQGAFLLPGLIDTHQHLATPPNRPVAEATLRRLAYSGVTAIRDMADDLRQIADLARATLVGEVPGPDIYYAALMAGPSFFVDPRTHAVSQGAVAGKTAWMQAIDEATDLRLAVALARGTGATAIKAYADIDGCLLEQMSTEAHAQGIQVWAHAAVFPASPREVVAAGVDAISHIAMLCFDKAELHQLSREERRTVRAELYARFLAGPEDALDAVLESLLERGTILDATASMAVEGLMEADDASTRVAVEFVTRVTARAHQLGVPISTGTDYETPPQAPYPALHDELTFLVERVGMTPAAVVRAATSVGALSMGKQDVMGTIEAGKLANLVIVADNPHEDIEALRSVVMTVKRGHQLPRADYVASIEGTR